MSLATLAQQAVDRLAARRLSAAGPAAPGAPPAVPTRDDALSSLAKYIPTEMVTLYLFGLSVYGTDADRTGKYALTLYEWLIAFTPVCFWLIFAAKFRAAAPGNAWPGLADVPWFRLIAATAAFVVWAPAVPKSGFIANAALAMGIAFFALVVSTFLSLLERLFEPRP